MACTRKWKWGRFLPLILKSIVFKICLIHAIHTLVRLHKDYKANSVVTVVKLHQNESVRLADTAVCVPLSFMTNDEKLLVAAKWTLLHDPTFLSKSLRLNDERAAQKYWDKKNNGSTSVTSEDLISSLINDTLKPFLKRNISFPDESPVDTFMAEQAEVFDIIETSNGELVNKTILLASVALIDVITGYGQGKDSASPLLSSAIADLTEQEKSTVSNMAKELLKNSAIADHFAFNVANTLCQIFAPEWTNSGEASTGPICGANGTLSKSPYYISLDQFCISIPTSKTNFTKGSPSASLSLTLPLSHTVFSFGPLSQYINDSTANLTDKIPSPNRATVEPSSPFDLALNLSSDGFNASEMDQGLLNPFGQQGASPFGFRLPFAFPQSPTANLSFLQLNETDKLKEKLEHQMQELLKSDFLSLAFKFPLVTSRTVSVYYPDDIRYYDSQSGPIAILKALDPLSLLTPPPDTSTTVEDFHSKVFEYVIKPTDLVEPTAQEVFGVSKSRSSIQAKSQCSDEVSEAACTKKCVLANTQTVCGCVPFGAHRFLNSSVPQLRFCQQDDGPCIDQMKDSDFSHTNDTVQDCTTKCRDVCSETKYKWREPKSKPAAISLDGMMNALVTGQPTHWTWTLTCDSFDYVEYVEKELITWNQYIAQVGGVFGFYGGILAMFFYVTHIVKKLKKCFNRRKKGGSDISPVVLVKADSVSDDYKRSVDITGEVRKAIEEAVRAELDRRGRTYEPATWKHVYEPIANGVAEKKEIPKNTYVSRMSVGP